MIFNAEADNPKLPWITKLWGCWDKDHFEAQTLIALAEIFQKKKLVTARMDSSEKQVTPKLS